MSGANSNHSDQRDLGQDRGETGASNDASWGEGSASALESLKKREQRRDHARPRQDEDDRPRASDKAGS